ncbi:MAG: hypothetical protein NVV73_17470 [Cellvibrionaceae bacterium]|nr:hypothetical protein [Cellvibrionaceae bacterium]
MKQYNFAMKALGVAVVAAMITACDGGGTSKSSNNQSPPPQTNPIPTDLTPVVLNQVNYTSVASQSLKSLLLNDAGSNALNKTVTITTEHNLELVNRVSGVVLTFAPYFCSNGGSFALKAVINNTNGDRIQLDLNSPLDMAFDAQFNECDQAGNSLDGNVSLKLNANLAQLLNNNQYHFDARMDVNSLSVEQPNMPSFVFDGAFQYKVRSDDGITVAMDILSNNTIYFADESYQMLDFSLNKTVNNASQEYIYFVSSEFTDTSDPSTYVSYQTLEPLLGKGFSLPSAGQLAVQGSNGTVFIHALEQDKLLLQLDLNNDGSIDEEQLTNWEDLVLNSFNVQR